MSTEFALHKPSWFDLFRKIGFKIKDHDIINLALRVKRLPYIVKIEQIKLLEDEITGTYYGYKVELSNGDIYEMKLKEHGCEDGNYFYENYGWEKTK